MRQMGLLPLSTAAQRMEGEVDDLSQVADTHIGIAM
jgi:hypothetical protein